MTIKFLNLNFATVILRFYLMMAVVIAAGFSGVWALGLLALPIFVSIMLGMTIELKSEIAVAPVKKVEKIKVMKVRKELDMVG